MNDIHLQLCRIPSPTFLEQQRTLTCATIGPRGWPHLMPLWYVLRVPGDGGPGPRLWAWTYAASQKVRNR